MTTDSLLDTRASASGTAMVARWLRLGYADLKAYPSACLSYGLPVVLLSCASLTALYGFGLSWMIPPALAGAFLVGPMASLGLFRISRRREGRGGGGVASPGQFVIVGAVLALLLLGWLRAATLLFALYYGLMPFPGAVEALQHMLTTPDGLAVLAGAVLTGAIFASFAFAVSAYSLQMMLDREIDAFSAMGRSLSQCGAHPRQSMIWGGVIGLAALAILLTGFLAAIVLFPLIGFASWHAYRDQLGSAAER
ncbi:MAG: DUF2189 domain-containing protein [Pseudomonadota bacterium]